MNPKPTLKIAPEEIPPGRKFNYWKYAIDWSAYIGELFTKISKVGDLVRDHFSGLSIPKKENYFNDR